MLKWLIENKRKTLIEQSLDNDYAIRIITVEGNAASAVYVKNKIKLLTDAGVAVTHHMMPYDLTQKELQLLVKSDGDTPILVQLPLPDHLTCPDIPYHQDVDMFGHSALGKIMQGDVSILPCTVQAVIDILDYLPIRGLKVAILGRSRIVGMPLSVALTHLNYTVTVFHSRSNLTDVDWKQFDVVISATGCHSVLESSMFCEGQLVIDVGISHVDGKIVGDVRHDSDNGASITPVPGGVGPLTVLNVLHNLIKLKAFLYGALR